MQLKVKRIGDHTLPLPAYQTDGAAAFDICVHLNAPYDLFDGSNTGWLPTGFAYELPPGHVMLVVPRSGVGGKGLTLTNGTGVIDEDYRGELGINLRYDGHDDFVQLQDGDRVAQAFIVPVRRAELVEVSELTPTKRGENGYGHTG